MKYIILGFLILTVYVACKKDKDDVNTPQTCDVKGIYSGIATPSVGTPATLVYTLKDNNFAVGSVTVGGASVTFGGYRNTCDSIVISSHFASNGNYYLLKGALNSGRTVLTGTFQNLTVTTDFGTFVLTKQ